MGTPQLKKHLVAYIERADERILRAMYAMLENYLGEEEQIVAFTPQGEPLTKKEMTRVLDDAVKETEQGKQLTTEDIREAKKNW